MAGKETKQEERARIIKHKRKKEEFRQAMKMWEVLARENPEVQVPEMDVKSFYCPYIPLMSNIVVVNEKSLIFDLETTA